MTLLTGIEKVAIFEALFLLTKPRESKFQFAIAVDSSALRSIVQFANRGMSLMHPETKLEYTS